MAFWNSFRPEEAEPTEDERKAIAKGEKEFARGGEYLRRTDINPLFTGETGERS